MYNVYCVMYTHQFIHKAEEDTNKVLNASPLSFRLVNTQYMYIHNIYILCIY